MSDIVLDGTTYSGTPATPGTPARPIAIERELLKIGREIVAADGSTSWVHRGLKWVWTIRWGPRASGATESAVSLLRQKTTTFSFTDVNSVAYTVLTSGEDSFREIIKTDKTNTYQYELELILKQV